MNSDSDHTLRLDSTFVTKDRDRYLQAIKSAKTKLESKGLIGTSQPNRPRPVVDKLFSEYSPKEALDLLGEYAAWNEYYSDLVKDYELELKAAEETLVKIKSRIRGPLRGDAATKSDILNNDPRFESASFEVFKAKSIFELAKGRYESAMSTEDSVSRIITSQGQDIQRTAKVSNSSRRHAKPFSGAR